MNHSHFPLRAAVLRVALQAAALAVPLAAMSAASHAAAPAAATGATAPSVLVRTAAVKHEALALQMTVYGDVASAVPQSLSFAQAGQLGELQLVPGQQVRRGQVLALLASDPAARAAYAQAASALGFAQRELERNRQLLAERLATQSQVDAAARQVADAQTMLHEQTVLGGAQGVVRLLAPFDAVVLAVPVAQGDRVAAGATVLQLGRTDKLRVQLALEPARAADVKAGMPVQLWALQDGGAGMRTSVAQVLPVVDPKSQMMGATVLLAGGQQAGLVPGARVRASITLASRDGWTVPRLAVLDDDQGSYLFQVAGHKARRVAVTKLVEQGALYGVGGKLDGALPVVVSGNYELQDGMAVREGGP